MIGSRLVVGDLFCGQGGAAAGYVRAGFDVIGVDIVDQPRYPCRFVQGDALEQLDGRNRNVDAWHASPPCHDHTVIQSRANVAPDGTADLLARTIDALRAQDRPWVVENVVSPSTRAAMPGAVLACGRALGIPRLARHRLFLTSFPLVLPPCRCAEATEWALGVYGDLSHVRRKAGTHAVKATIAEARDMFEAPWMDAKGLAQAIPARYTQAVGAQLAVHLMTIGANR